MDLDKVVEDWGSHVKLQQTRPTLISASETVIDLVLEIKKLRKELEYEKKRQDIKEQHFKTMFVELHNVVNKYT